MSAYPTIDPADVREGDEIEVTYRLTVNNGVRPSDIGIIAGHSTLFGGPVEPATVHLVNRPTPPPEPPLRVGDWVRVGTGDEGQIDEVDSDNVPSIFYVPACRNWFTAGQIARIEPPVGWPVAAPTPDGVRWWLRASRVTSRAPYTDLDGNWLSWADLVADGGIPAIAPGATP